jgi:formylglycine-generating enzyme required for sulfatase activity
MKPAFFKPIRFSVSLCVAVWLVAVRVSAQAPPGLSVQVSNTWASLWLTCDVGNACTIQYRTGFSPTNNWQFLHNLTPVPTRTTLFLERIDAAVPRFYRAFSQQLPTNVVPVPFMTWIPSGTFVMGSPSNEALRNSNESQHTVTLTKGFYMGRHEVTQGDYLSLTSTNPSTYTGDLSRPVEQVSWSDATNYCGKLTRQEQLAGRLPVGWVYRLPTESEWEYACRAGTTTALHYGNELRGGMANFYSYYEYDALTGETLVSSPTTYLDRPTAMGSYQPNPWGLYDMHGNVWEWCRDYYGTYPVGSLTDPQGPISGGDRVMRGGSWCTRGMNCRSALRNSIPPAYKRYDLGFRIVLAQGQP